MSRWLRQSSWLIRVKSVCVTLVYFSPWQDTEKIRGCNGIWAFCCCIIAVGINKRCMHFSRVNRLWVLEYSWLCTGASIPPQHQEATFPSTRMPSLSPYFSVPFPFSSIFLPFSFSFPFFLFCFPPPVVLFFFSLPLEVGPLNPARCSGKRCKLS